MIKSLVTCWNSVFSPCFVCGVWLGGDRQYYKFQFSNFYHGQPLTGNDLAELGAWSLSHWTAREVFPLCVQGSEILLSCAFTMHLFSCLDLGIQ